MNFDLLTRVSKLIYRINSNKPRCSIKSYVEHHNQDELKQFLSQYYESTIQPKINTDHIFQYSGEICNANEFSDIFELFDFVKNSTCYKAIVSALKGVCEYLPNEERNTLLLFLEGTLINSKYDRWIQNQIVRN